MASEVLSCYGVQDPTQFSIQCPPFLFMDTRAQDVKRVIGEGPRDLVQFTCVVLEGECPLTGRGRGGFQDQFLVFLELK